MKASLNFLSGRQTVLSGAILFSAAIFFNNWLLAFLLNRRLLFKGGSISELGIHGQPHALIFQSLDVLAGILFVFFALLVRSIMRSANRSGHVLIWGTVIFGITNSIDALLTLPCSNTLDKGCNIPITINWSHFNFPSHGYSSVLIALCYFILPLAGFFYARARKMRSFGLLSIVALIVALASFVSAIWGYLNLHAFSVHASGFAQGVQMLVLGTWFIVWGLSASSSSAKEKTAD